MMGPALVRPSSVHSWHRLPTRRNFLRHVRLQDAYLSLPMCARTLVRPRLAPRARPGPSNTMLMLRVVESGPRAAVSKAPITHRTSALCDTTSLCINSLLLAVCSRLSLIEQQSHSLLSAFALCFNLIKHPPLSTLLASFLILDIVSPPQNQQYAIPIRGDHRRRPGGAASDGHWLERRC